MGVLLTWKDNNLSEDGHRIYRSTSPMDPENLPSPLATLGPGVGEYVDGTTLSGLTYYYRVGAFVGGVELVSQEFVVTAEEADEPEAIFSFASYSQATFPVNRVLFTEGLSGAFTTLGVPVAWGLQRISGEHQGSDFFDPDVNYDELPWPYSPIVEPEGDYTVRLDSGAENMVFDITGLDPLKTYDLRFTGSRFSSGSRNVGILIDGTRKTINAVNNNSRQVEFLGVAPDSLGVIRFQFTDPALDGANWGYLSALFIKEVIT